ncbi:hypothetical protein BCR37DRAFT_390405 [Protomyces lactucae-debilis]|uniref:Uncharacterized protein n=1 Tax=Protomyces lactucae-debilis TaxID=2754530 RepID=A0A1Y2FWI2_PROLT|nr:uncharacterized protein BCR37DRAFT_390405 [Protomyces lactucae-debilis]ORY87897.1 hypothetical protein BCR37DRAFT_390405 [Protomyces lactucae-debilis]
MSRFSSTLADAHAALQAENLPKAQTLFQELTRQPKATTADWYNLGVVQWMQRDAKGAVESWQAALKAEEADKQTLSSCHTNLANYFLLAKQDAAKASSHLAEAVKLTPEDGEIRYNYGLVLEKQDELQLALENYLRAEEAGVLKEDPSKMETLIRNVSAKLLARNKDIPESEQEIEARRMLDEAKEKADAGGMGTQVDWGKHGDGR